MFFKKKDEFEQRQVIVAYKNIFHSQMGKEVLFDLINRFHVLNPHSGESFDEGQRSVVLHIIKQCNINLDQFDELLKGESE